MRWERLGLVFRPDGSSHWMVSHAANPVPEHLGEDRFRVYFGGRDSANRTSIGFVELDLREPRTILRISDKPVVAPGPRGVFDDSGASMGCLVHLNGTSL